MTPLGLLRGAYSMDGQKWVHSVRFSSAETEPCSTRQDDAFLSWILLVCAYPDGWPQAGTM